MRPPGQVSGLKGLFDVNPEARLVQLGDSCKVSVSIHWRHPPPKHHAAWTRHRKQVAIPRERQRYFRTLAHTVRTKPTPGSFSDLDHCRSIRFRIPKYARAVNGVVALLKTGQASDLISASAFSSQYVISISLYIVVAVVRCSRA